jgi:flagellar hook protein FlgE
MELQSAFSSGLQGLQRASNGITEATVNINRETANEQRVRNAQDTASVEQSNQQKPALVAESSKPSLEQSLVKLVTEQNYAEANVKSIKTADEVLGSVIDIRV